MNSDISLGYYSQIALIFSEVLSKDIILYLIQCLKDSETEEARDFHMSRLCQDKGFLLRDPLFSIWWAYNERQSEIIEDLKMLNDETFWEMQVCEWGNQVISRKMIPLYSYENPNHKPWDSPVYTRRLQKLDLLKKYYTTIKVIWYKRQRRCSTERIRLSHKIRFRIGYGDVWELCSP